MSRSGRLRLLPLAAMVAATLAACTVSRVAPAPPRPAAPLPLTLGVCPLPTGAPADPFGPDGALFARVVDARAADARPDLVAHVTATPRTRDVRDSSVGFFLWTLGIVPMAAHTEQTAAVALRRPPPGGDPCAGEAADALTIVAPARETAITGWVALLLQPTPWWSAADASQPGEDRKLAGLERAAIARAVLERRAELLTLAGR